MQAAGAEVSAQLEFLDQQNLILGMENRALKQRLDSLSQEHFIKSSKHNIFCGQLVTVLYSEITFVCLFQAIFDCMSFCVN